MTTKLDGGGCYEAALPDEPMFTLLARDPYAPELVRLWARNRGESIAAGKRPREDEEQVRLARLCADEMSKWRDANLNKWQGHSTLSGVQSSERRATLNFIGRRINDLALKGALVETVDALIKLSGEIVAGFHFDRVVHPADTLGETVIDLPPQDEQEPPLSAMPEVGSGDE